MSVKNEVVAGHIAFLTTASPNEPDPIVVGHTFGYNARVRRQFDGEVAVNGGYIVTVGRCMAPPADADADINVTSSRIIGAGNAVLWTGVNVTDLGVNVDGDREYQLNVEEEVLGGASIQVSDTAGVVVRFTCKRVNPRAT